MPTPWLVRQLGCAAKRVEGCEMPYGSRGDAAMMAQHRAEVGDSHRFGSSGRLSMQVTQGQYFDAVNAHGGVSDDGTTIWDDPDFKSHVARTMPECVADRDVIAAGGMRNRFGRVKERIVFRKQPDGSMRKITIRGDA